MADLFEGYIRDIDYTYDCYHELNPSGATLGFLKAGLVPPPQPATACELGFGFGVSANIHAAASQTEWWGTDFNSGQVAFARELAEASGANAKLFDESFADFCNRPDLPDFDFIGLHGIWTWVSEENRHLIIDFIRRRLKPGGFIYASYNTQPGWSQIVPLRLLLTEHAETMSAFSMPIAERIKASIDFAEGLIEASPSFSALYPLMAGRLKGLRNYSPNYLAHEYFNRSWQPMLFSEIANAFEHAKAAFACSADFAHHFDHHSLTPTQTDILAKIPDARMRESSRDFVINRQFRKDYWVKGARRLDYAEQMDALRSHRVILLTNASEVTSAVPGALVGSTIPERVFKPLMELLDGFKVLTIEKIARGLEPLGVNFTETLEAVMILVGKRNVSSVQKESVVSGALVNSARLNRHLLEKAAYSSSVTALASPLTGGGVTVHAPNQRMLLERARGLKTPAEWADAMWQDYLAKGTRCFKNGQMLLTSEENLAFLTEEAESFNKNSLPRLIALKVVD